MTFFDSRHGIVQPRRVPNVVAVEHRARPVTANLHGVGLASPYVR